MDSKLKILLFAHPRSGSTTLLQILNLHPDINLMPEPFNENREKWTKNNKNYVNETETITDLNRVLKDIHKNHNGFKHLSYQLPEKLTKYLLKNKGYRVIFLYRKNLLRSVVSTSIAKQTKVWTPEEKEQKGELKFLEPLNIKEMREEIDYLKHSLDTYLSMARQAKTPLFEITYEDLFAASEDEGLEKVKEIFEFLGLDFPENKLKNIQKLLSPKRKMTNNKTYNLIPNIRKIEKELGSEENGFLFK